MSYFMGIDGGGSNLRVVIVDETMTIQIECKRATANPSIIGHDPAASTIQDAMREAIQMFPGIVDDIIGVGIGVAGASATYADEWLREVVLGVLPDTNLATSSDNEIALVAAHGIDQGVLILSGTGSVAYGINQRGESLQVGGWGYLLDDVGSGYWLGLQAIRTMLFEADGRLLQSSTLPNRVREALPSVTPENIVNWMYNQDQPRNREIAKLARLVLEEADAGDWRSLELIQKASQELTFMTNAVIRKLSMQAPKIQFAGGLLQFDNLLSRSLCEQLDLPQLPSPRYPPVIGAALLAKLRLEKTC